MGTAIPTDRVNKTIAIVIVLKYNGGMYDAVDMVLYRLCLWKQTIQTFTSNTCTGSVSRNERYNRSHQTLVQVVCLETNKTKQKFTSNTITHKTQKTTFDVHKHSTKHSYVHQSSQTSYHTVDSS